MSFLKLADHDKKKKHVSGNRQSVIDPLADERKKQEDKEREESLKEKEKLLAEIALERKTLEEKGPDDVVKKKDSLQPEAADKRASDSANGNSPRRSSPRPALAESSSEQQPAKPLPIPPDSPRVTSTPPPTQEKYQEQIVNEILTSERLFLESITRISVHFKVPFLNKALLHGTAVGEMEIKTLVKIFSFIDRIILFSSTFVQNLEACIGPTGVDIVKLCDLVIELIPEMKKAFINYIVNFDLAGRLLEKLSKENEEFQKILEYSSSTCAPLNSLLIMPVQRVPRYELLFKELLKYVPDTHAASEKLKLLLSQLKEALVAINETKRQHESKLRIGAMHIVGLDKHWLEGKIFTDDADIKIKHPNQITGHIRSVILFEGFLLVCKPRDSHEINIQMKPRATHPEALHLKKVFDISTSIFFLNPDLSFSILEIETRLWTVFEFSDVSIFNRWKNYFTFVNLKFMGS